MIFLHNKKSPDICQAIKKPYLPATAEGFSTLYFFVKLANFTIYRLPGFTGPFPSTTLDKDDYLIVIDIITHFKILSTSFKHQTTQYV